MKFKIKRKQSAPEAKSKSKKVKVKKAEPFKATGTLLFLMDAEDGAQYTTWERRAVYMKTGQAEDRDGVPHHRVKAYSINGDTYGEVFIHPLFPLLEDQQAVDRITLEYKRKKNFATNGGDIGRSQPSKVEKKRAVESEDDGDPETPPKKKFKLKIRRAK